MPSPMETAGMIGLPQRADAVRNRGRILDAAAAAFGAHGASVSIEEIAREAGVGTGTIYRHFTNRDALLQAVVSQRMDEIVASARSTPGTPAEVLFGFIDMMGRTAADDEGLTDAIAETATNQQVLATVESSFMQLLDELVIAAQTSGELRDDLSARSVKAMIVGQQSVARTGDAAAAAAHLGVIERGARSPANPGS
jgi:AcrR family transcriptional regulator